MDENTGENAPIPEESGAVEIKAENLFSFFTVWLKSV